MNKIKEGLYRILCYTGICKNATITKDNSTNAIVSDVENIVTNGNVRNSVPHVFPYGYMSIPNDNVRMVIVNAGITGQSPIVIGSLNSLTEANPVTIAKGEGFNYSNNWILKYGNAGLTAYKIDNANYLATLPSGEWFIKFVRDLINDNNVVLRDYINQQINIFLRTHVHTGGTISGNTGEATTTIVDITSSVTLSQDDGYAAAQNCLLNDNAIVVP